MLSKKKLLFRLKPKPATPGVGARSVVGEIGIPTPIPDEELPEEMRRTVSRMMDRNDRRELEELESLLRDAVERGDDESALRGRVDSLRQRIQGRQKESGDKSAWLKDGTR